MQQTLLVMRIFFFGLCLFGSWVISYVNPDINPMTVFIVGSSIGVLVILTDIYLKGFSLSGFTALTFGLGLGLVFSILISSSPLFEPLEKSEFASYVFLVRLVMSIVMMYLGAVIAVRGRDEFYIVIPYVRFDPKFSEQSVIVLDTSVLIDGRIEALCRSRWLTKGLVIPSFVLQELQGIADSPDPQKRDRGRRGLKVLNEMRKMKIDLRIHELDLEQNERVDDKLITLASSMRARLLTTDYNLAQMAQFKGIEWLNLNELTKAVLPEPEVGAEFDVELVREGKEPHQAVGYLRDGSMVVVNNAHRRVGETVKVEIGSVIPSAGGKMIFADICDS